MHISPNVSRNKYMRQQRFNKNVENEVEIKQNYKNNVSLIRTHLKLGVSRPTLKSIQPKNIIKQKF